MIHIVLRFFVRLGLLDTALVVVVEVRVGKRGALFSYHWRSQSLLALFVQVHPTQHFSPKAQCHSMLHRYCYFQFFLISLLGQVILASINVRDRCLPRCCASGELLDPSGTTCLRNPSTQIQPDACGRRNSFLPKCEIEDEAGEKKVVTSLSGKLFYEDLTRP